MRERGEGDEVEGDDGRFNLEETISIRQGSFSVAVGISEENWRKQARLY